MVKIRYLPNRQPNFIKNIRPKEHIIQYSIGDVTKKGRVDVSKWLRSLRQKLDYHYNHRKKV